MSRCLLLPIALFNLPLLVFAQPQADVNGQDHFGVTELMRAACDPVRIKALIETGANVNLASDTGWTALLGTAMGGTLLDKTPPGCVQATQELIAAGANLNARETNTGRTPLIYATMWRRTQVAEVLITAGADLNIALPRWGETALILAALSGQSELVQALILAGANLTQREKDGATALTLAAWNCHADIVEALKQAGARPEPTAWRELRQPQFEDFSVSAAYKGPHAPVGLGSNPEAQTYRTRLREGAKKPPNFAGHYVMVEWGCGTECTVYMMVDVKNGRVFDAPQALMGGAFRLNSSLFIEILNFGEKDTPDEEVYAAFSGLVRKGALIQAPSVKWGGADVPQWKPATHALAIAQEILRSKFGWPEAYRPPTKTT